MPLRPRVRSRVRGFRLVIPGLLANAALVAIDPHRWDGSGRVEIEEIGTVLVEDASPDPGGSLSAYLSPILLRPVSAAKSVIT